MALLPNLDHFLTLLQDGAWHSLQSLATQSLIPAPNLEPLARLLADTDIVDYDAAKKRLRLRREWQTMLEHTEDPPKKYKAAVGTVIIPPKQTVSIQEIKITNLTDHELEIGLRVNDKLNELAISTLD